VKALRWVQQIAAALVFTERGRFVCGTCLWGLSFLKDLRLPFVIALFGAFYFRQHFVELAKRTFAKEWPYTLLGVLGVLFLYFVSRLSSIGANILIAAITGFHPTIFPNSFLALSLAFDVLLLLVAVMVASGLIAIAAGFSYKSSRRVFPITFGLTVPIMLAILPTFTSRTADVSGFERLILALDFNRNARFEGGGYKGENGLWYRYGTKVCRHLDIDALIAPIPQGGYVLATPREIPAQRQHEAPGELKPVFATKNVYSRVPQDECPHINEYTEEPR
jgi:hypothetical protein